MTGSNDTVWAIRQKDIFISGDKNQGRITGIAEVTGNQITWLETDPYGCLWAGTNLGVNIINLNLLYENNILEVRFLDREDGFYDPAVTSSFSAPDGNIWLGGRGRLSIADTKAATRSAPGPRQIFIRQATLDYQVTDWREFAETEHWTGSPVSGISLKHYLNNLGFFFSTAQIAGSEKTLFRYRIVGLNDYWSPFDRSDMVIFPNLPPGRYLLQAEAQLAFYEKSRGSMEFYFRIPPMLLQPFVENAILHGLVHKDRPGKLKIGFATKGTDVLQCIIEDDGIGRKQSEEINRGRHKNHKSVGLEISGRRVGLMNRPGQKDFRIEITDLYDRQNRPRGTKIVLFIPLESIDIPPEQEEWD